MTDTSTRHFFDDQAGPRESDRPRESDLSQRVTLRPRDAKGFSLTKE